jgi:hypothetical protein
MLESCDISLKVNDKQQLLKGVIRTNSQKVPWNFSQGTSHFIVRRSNTSQKFWINEAKSQAYRLKMLRSETPQLPETILAGLECLDQQN